MSWDPWTVLPRSPKPLFFARQGLVSVKKGHGCPRTAGPTWAIYFPRSNILTRTGSEKEWAVHLYCLYFETFKKHEIKLKTRAVDI